MAGTGCQRRLTTTRPHDISQEMEAECENATTATVPKTSDLLRHIGQAAPECRADRLRAQCFLSVSRRGRETQRGQHGFQAHALTSVQVWPVPAAPPQEQAVEMAEAHRDSRERQVFPVDRHVAVPGAEACPGRGAGPGGRRRCRSAGPSRQGPSCLSGPGRPCHGSSAPAERRHWPDRPLMARFPGAG
jgi:hypothetical protein